MWGLWIFMNDLFSKRVGSEKDKVPIEAPNL